jgi:hypothetical protein
MAWLKHLWEEVQGNAKWDIIKWMLAGAAIAGASSLALIWRWFYSEPLVVRGLVLIVGALLFANCVLLCLWLKGRRRSTKPASTIGEPNGLPASSGAEAQAQHISDPVVSPETPGRPQIEQTPLGFKCVFRGTDIFVDFGILQKITVNLRSSVVVLPANEFFDKRCFEDAGTSAGAFVHWHLPKQGSKLQRIVHDNLRGVPVELVERPGQISLRSFGVGTCAFVDRPFHSELRLIFAAVASDRPPDGLQTDLSTIYRVVERIRCIVAAERGVSSLYMPLIGAGKGGVAPEIAFHALLGALLEARCRSGGHHLKEVHLVVYAPDGRQPQLAPDRAKYHVNELVTLYQVASR